MSQLVSLDQCSIRRATQDDFLPLLLLENAAHSYPWADEVMQSMLKARAIRGWVVNDPHHKILAFAFVQAVADEASLLNIAVSPQYQGMGLGRYLLNHLIDVLTQEGVAQSFFLEVRVGNRYAIQLYDSCGFVEIGQRREYYQAVNNTREDALMMALPLQISYM